MKKYLIAALLLLAPAAGAASAQEMEYMVHPGGAVTGTDNYGNSYSGTMNPGGTMTMTDRYGRTFDGPVDPFGNGSLSR